MSDDDAARPPALRAGDADRERVTSTLGDAAAAGYLSMQELDERLGRAVAARTVRELDLLLTDLPPHWLAQRARALEAERERAAARAAARAELGPHLRAYVAVMALLVGIWLVVGLSTSDAWYPWPIWPALGWGIGIAAQARAALRA